MKRLFLVVLIALWFQPFATAQMSSPEGIYYLEGVMETASGIKLDADSTFEFFFSQGALDRTGKGHWTLSGDELILQSDSLPAKGFELVKSEKIKNKKAVVVIKEQNSMLLSFVYVQLSGDQPAEFLKLGTDGAMELEAGKIKKIALLFELCPERIHEYTPLHEGDNYFEFTIHPNIMDVYFNNVKVKFVDGGFNGQHPLLKGEAFFYRKNN